MKTSTSKFAIAILAIALIGSSVALTATSAEARPGKGTKGVSGMDLGSGR